MQMRFGIFRPVKRVVTLGGHVGRRVVTLDDVKKAFPLFGGS